MVLVDGLVLVGGAGLTLVGGAGLMLVGRAGVVLVVAHYVLPKEKISPFQGQHDVK